MMKPARTGSLSRSRVAVAAIVAVAVGIASAQARSPRKPTPADLAKQRSQDVETPSVKPPASPEVLKQREDELDSLRAEQQKAADAEKKLATENEMLSEERRKLTAALIIGATGIRAGEERVTATEARMHALEGNEADIRKSLIARRALISEVLAALQRIGHHPPPAVFGGAQDALESIRTAMALGAVLPEMRLETEGLMSELSNLVRVRKDLATERDRQSTELAALGAEQKRMEALVEERQKRQAEVEHAMEEERQRVASLARQADNLKDLIAKLEQGVEAARRAARLAARPPPEPKPADTKPSPAAKDSTRLEPVIAFAAAKGTLSLPAAGAKVKDFGATDKAGGTEKGISIATRSGAQVIAPSDGWVVYAAPYRSYGQLLILNVGGGYHVLLAGMERITVDLGQFVLTGEPVAVMGSGTQVASSSSTSASTMPLLTTGADAGSPKIDTVQPVLYIEFRKDGTPVDPTPWWAGNNSEKVRG
jgi:murein hydrolase activator